MTLRKGRTVKLNKQTLVTRAGKSYAEVVFFGDLHLGHPTCLLEKATKMLNHCLEKKVYVLIMGDILECGLTNSIGDSVYSQKLNPQAQMEDAIELFIPLAKEGLILGIHEGNHENRILKVTSINIAKIMAGILNVPYLYQACWNLFKVGKINYTVYSLHGASGSRFIYTKLKAVTDISHYFDANIIAMGHVHDLACVPFEKQRVDMRNKVIDYYKKYVILTGHYLGYQLSYAQAKGMPPSKVGSPKVELGAEEFSIYSSI